MRSGGSRAQCSRRESAARGAPGFAVGGSWRALCESTELPSLTVSCGLKATLQGIKCLKSEASVGSYSNSCLPSIRPSQFFFFSDHQVEET